MLGTENQRCDIQICFKTQEHPIQPGKVVDPAPITSPPRTEMHIQPFQLLLIVGGKQ